MKKKKIKKKNKKCVLCIGDVHETFRSIDTNGDKFIDREELRQVLFRLGDEVTDEDVDACFNVIDTNHDNQISFEEFYDWYHKSKFRMKADVSKIFAKYDSDEDKMINKEEFIELLTAVNDGEPPSKDDVEKAYNEFDKNKDGLIDEFEFLNWYFKTPHTFFHFFFILFFDFILFYFIFF